MKKCDIGWHKFGKWIKVSENQYETHRWSRVQEKNLLLRTELVYVQKRICEFCDFIELNTQRTEI